MKSLSWLTLIVLASAGTMCGAPTVRDAKRITDRVAHEGDSFLTITLPAFGQDFLRSLDQGQIADHMFLGFKRQRDTRLPRFLSGFVQRVFDNTGAIRPDPDVQSISCVIQICMLHKKVLLPCTKERELSAERRFLAVDDECNVYGDLPYDDPARKLFRHVAAIILSDMTKGSPYGIPEEWQPRHGPGVNTTRTFGNAKWEFQEWNSRFDWFFPWSEYGHGSIQVSLDLLAEENHSGIRGPTPTFVSPTDETPVKVVFVPKTLKSPRVIAVESQAMQFAQQAMRHWLVECIQQSTYTKGRINFSDQTCNQSLALSASRDGKFATLDMKDASDLVTLGHVNDLFCSNPLLLEMVLSLRSSHATLPSGHSVALKKFASMGSAICFPVEAFAFFVASVSSRLQGANRLPTPAHVKRMCGQVYVYGDDIIVPANEAPVICETLDSKYKFRVNHHKSFWTGRYRESCGSDAYDGTPVTPVYCRRTYPADKRDAESIVSWVSLANQLYAVGHWDACMAVREALETLLGPLPRVSDDSSILGWKSIQQWKTIHGWDGALQRFIVKGYTITPAKEADPLEGYAALRKCLSLLNGREPSLEWYPSANDDEHLTRSVQIGRAHV